MFIAASFTIAKCWKQPKCPSINEWMEKLWYIYLHNGILCSRKKGGASTLRDSMGGTGEHYVMWNKPGGEKQIPYDLIHKWKLINKTNSQGKYNRRLWNKKQTDSNQRGVEGRGRQWGKERKVSPRNIHKGPMEKTEWGKVMVGKWRQLYLNNNKNNNKLTRDLKLLSL